MRKKIKIPRAFLRKSPVAKVMVSCHKKGSTDTASNLTTSTLDLSEAGARLLVRAPLEVGEDVVLGLEGPGNQSPLLRQGKVVWSFKVTKNGYVVGVCLKDHLDGEEIKKVTINPVRLDY